MFPGEMIISTFVVTNGGWNDSFQIYDWFIMAQWIAYVLIFQEGSRVQWRTHNCVTKIKWFAISGKKKIGFLASFIRVAKLNSLLFPTEGSNIPVNTQFKWKWQHLNKHRGCSESIWFTVRSVWIMTHRNHFSSLCCCKSWNESLDVGLKCGTS